jgi:hypothetical protein
MKNVKYFYQKFLKKITIVYHTMIYLKAGLPECLFGSVVL